ncbi:MAG TPA: efflux RND transporter periplasmic adaptor subunit [Polyangiaceae bacterium]|nr:efflux RND transporter periplasmic adaptor subunit [Polyangiaceae bacterium]
MTQAQIENIAPQGADPKVLAVVGKGKRGRKGVWILVVAVLLAIAGGVAYWQLGASAAPNVRYQTRRVERGDLQVSVTATGTIKARDTVPVGAEITGRVLAVHVNFNDQVKEGQVLAEIDTEQLKARAEESNAQLAAANASLLNARATAVEAKQKLDRMKGLFAQQLTSQQELEAAEATKKRADASVASASSQVTLAQASLKVAKTNMSKAVIKSPINGVVLDRTVEPGQTVTSGLQTPQLFVLAADLSQLQLNVQVDEADVGSVKEEQSAIFTVDAFAQQTFASKVLAVKNTPTAGVSVVTYEAWLSVDNEKRLLRPGMTATSTITVDERKGVLLVPNAALRFSPRAKAQAQGFSVNQLLPTNQRMRPQGGGQAQGGGQRPGGGAGGGRGPRKPGVFILENGELKRIEVETGATDGVRTEIRSGEINEGTEVVVSVMETTGG